MEKTVAQTEINACQYYKPNVEVQSGRDDRETTVRLFYGCQPRSFHVTQ